MRVQTEELEQAMDGALGDSGLFGYGAHAPMCCSLGLASECFADQLGHGLILDRARPAGPRLVVEPFDPVGDEAIAPLADGLRHDTQSLGNTALLGSRSQASTILARSVSPAGIERDRAIAKRWARSSPDIVSIAFGRPVRIGYLLRSGYPKPMQ